MSRKQSPPLHVAMLIDAWFPSKHISGVFGGGQVHVRELKKHLELAFPINITLFYPTHSHIIFRSLWTFFVVIKLILYHRINPFQLIHSQGYNTGISAKIASKLLGIPVIHTVHGSNLIDQKKPGIKTNLERWLLTQIKYDRQISVAESFKKHPNVNQIIIIPNGVVVEKFDAVKSKKATQPTLIWVGRDDPVKGLSILKDALRLLRKDFPQLQAELVSGGRLTGNKLIKAYKAAHIFVLPSLSEGQPITLLEAWAAKLPVVVTAVGDNPNLVQDHVNGILISPGSVRQLVVAIKELLSHPDRAVKLGLAGYRYVSVHHQWSQIAAQTYHVYQQVIAGLHKPGHDSSA